MCGPAAIGIIGIVVALAGTATSVVAQRQAGKNAQRAARYNAQIRGQQATDIVARGEREANAHRQRARDAIALNRVGAAAGGLLTTEGNPLELGVQIAAFGELDAMTIRSNADREAYFLRAGTRIDQYEGELALSNSNDRARATAIAGFGSALQQGASINFGGGGGAGSDLISTEN